nr:hypothetical protein [Tanacetum cinerariifolium]
MDEILRQHMMASDAKFQLLENQMTKIEKTFNERPQGAFPSNTVLNPMEDIKLFTTRSGITLVRPSVTSPNPSSYSSKEVERDPKTTMDQVHISSSESIARFPYLMFKKLHFNISFAEALAQMLKYVKMLKDLLINKEKLIELANTPFNKNRSAVLLKKFHEKLGDPRKFLIPCDFSELEECLALADLELANQSVAYPVGTTEDVFVQVGKFTFPADFVVVDYEVDPRVSIILRRLDCHGGSGGEGL